MKTLIPCWKITDTTDKACHLYVRRDQGDEAEQIDSAFYDVKQWLLSKPANDEKTRFTIEAVQLHPQEWEDMDTDDSPEWPENKGGDSPSYRASMKDAGRGHLLP